MNHVNDVANWMLDRAAKDGKPLTPMQLLKLVYLAQGYMLGAFRRPLFEQEVQAWAYGPVVRELYQDIKKYRNQPITSRLASHNSSFDEDELGIMDAVYDAYSGFDGIKLSAITHIEKSPWDIVWRMKGKNSIIPSDLMEIYFDSLIVKNEDQNHTAAR